MFHDALMQMEQEKIVTLTRTNDSDVGIHGVWLVEVDNPAVFATRIWPGANPAIITFFPPGYKSEAKKPKNTFIAQWDRKGFEHSYNILEDLKISSPSYNGQRVHFQMDIRFRRIVAFLLEILESLQKLTDTPMSERQTLADMAQVVVKIQCNLKVS